MEPWTFERKKDLERALREYTSLLDGTQTRKYGVDEAPRPAAESKETEDYETAVLRWRSTIDKGMEQVEDEHPRLHKIIDQYYRRGLSTEPMGWLAVSAAIGIRRKPCPGRTQRCTIEQPGFIDNRYSIPKCRQGEQIGCGDDYRRWQAVLGIAVDTLWQIIQNQQGRSR